MGLDTSHDCWHGAYSSFMRWRQKLCEVAGLPPLDFMEGFWEQGSYRDPMREEAARWPEVMAVIYRCLPIRWDALKPDPLYDLLYHSDCEGEIPADRCGPIADSLERLVPLMPDADGGGHIWNWRAITERFVRGLRAAAAAGEPVVFR